MDIASVPKSCEGSKGRMGKSGKGPLADFDAQAEALFNRSWIAANSLNSCPQLSRGRVSNQTCNYISRTNNGFNVARNASRAGLPKLLGSLEAELSATTPYRLSQCPGHPVLLL